MLPFAIRFALLTDLALNAIAAVAGPDHVMLIQSQSAPFLAQSAQFGVLVTAGIVLHELGKMCGDGAKAVLRWRRRVRKTR